MSLPTQSLHSSTHTDFHSFEDTQRAGTSENRRFCGCVTVSQNGDFLAGSANGEHWALERATMTRFPLGSTSSHANVRVLFADAFVCFGMKKGMSDALRIWLLNRTGGGHVTVRDGTGPSGRLDGRPHGIQIPLIESSKLRGIGSVVCTRTPTGRRLIFACGRGFGNAHLWALDVTEEPHVPVTNMESSDAANERGVFVTTAQVYLGSLKTRTRTIVGLAISEDATTLVTVGNAVAQRWDIGSLMEQQQQQQQKQQQQQQQQQRANSAANLTQQQNIPSGDPSVTPFKVLSSAGVTIPCTLGAFCEALQSPEDAHRLLQEVIDDGHEMQVGNWIDRQSQLLRGEIEPESEFEFQLCQAEWSSLFPPRLLDPMVYEGQVRLNPTFICSIAFVCSVRWQTHPFMCVCLWFSCYRCHVEIIRRLICTTDRTASGYDSTAWR
jgi:hypothetical protein